MTTNCCAFRIILFIMFTMIIIVLETDAEAFDMKDRAVVDHYTYLQVSSAKSFDSIKLSNGSQWKTSTESLPWIQALEGKSIEVQWRSKNVENSQGDYIFVDNDPQTLERDVGLFSISVHREDIGPFFPIAYALTVKKVETLSTQLQYPPNTKSRGLYDTDVMFGGLNADWLKTMLVTLSDDSQWTVSLLVKNATNLGVDGRPTTEVGTGVQIAWFKDSNGAIFPVMVQSSSLPTLTIEGIR